MRVGIDHQRLRIQIPLPTKLDSAVSMMQAGLPPGSRGEQVSREEQDSVAPAFVHAFSVESQLSCQLPGCWVPPSDGRDAAHRCSPCLAQVEERPDVTYRRGAQAGGWCLRGRMPACCSTTCRGSERWGLGSTAYAPGSCVHARTRARTFAGSPCLSGRAPTSPLWAPCLQRRGRVRRADQALDRGGGAAAA